MQSIVRGAGTLLLLWLVSANGRAAPEFAHVFRPDPEQTAPDSGILVTAPTGAFLEYGHLTPDGPEGIVWYTIGGTRFDAAGNMRWSLQPEVLRVVFGDTYPGGAAGPDRPSENTVGTWGIVTPLAHDADKARVLYSLETGTYRFGVLDVSASSAVYAYEVGFDPATEVLYSIADEHDVDVVFRYDDSSMSLLGVDASGAILFDSVVTSAAFQNEVSAGGLLRQASVSPLADGSGYYLTADIALEPAGHRCAIVRLDAAGTLIWARVLQPIEQDPAGDASPSECAHPAVGPDGSLVYVLGDLAIDETSGSSSSRTGMMRLDPDGNLSWAQTFDSVLLFVGSFAPDGTHLILAGSMVASSSFIDLRSAGILARVDAATGAVTHEFRLPEVPDWNSVLAVFASSEQHVYAGRPRDTEAPPDFFRLNLELGDVTGYRQEQALWQAGSGTFQDGRLPMSEFDDATGEVRAFTVDEDLVPNDPACPTATTVPIAVAAAEPGLMVIPLQVEVETPAVDVAPAGTTLSVTELPVRPLTVEMAGCSG